MRVGSKPVGNPKAAQLKTDNRIDLLVLISEKDSAINSYPEPYVMH